MTHTVASPSLALIKYWGKADEQSNLPATSSLAITLKDLCTKTTVSLTEKEDTLVIDGKPVSKERISPFFDNLRATLRIPHYFRAESQSNFPTSAGLASSSSGFAALAYGCTKACSITSTPQQLSELARIGSASAARAVFDGFTILERGSLSAKPLYQSDHWPELRVIIAIVKGEKKKISSREAMNLAKKTSPYYPEWIAESEKIYQMALRACQDKDLATLGPLMRKSYLMMFSTMFTSTPPVLYWEPQSVALIRECEALRNEGFNLWETMDAGPQVKMVCLENEAGQIFDRLKRDYPSVEFLLTEVGTGPKEV